MQGTRQGSNSRSGAAAAASRGGGTAHPPYFTSVLGCTAVQVVCLAFLILLSPLRALRIAKREIEGRFDAALPPLPCFVFGLFKIIFISCFLPFFSPGSLPAPRAAVSPGEAGALRMHLSGTSRADSWSGFIDSRLLPSSWKQPELVPVRIANCREQ